MFCGWRLVNSYRALASLGSGKLEIDALRQVCKFNEIEIPCVPIAVELAVWLRDDLAAHKIDTSALQVARLTARLSFSQVPSKSRVTQAVHFTATKKPVTRGVFQRLNIACTSLLTTDEAQYMGALEDIQEWPLQWPDA